MKKQLLLTLLLGAAISHAQAPQIPMTGNLGAGGSFPAINSPAVVFASDANHTMVFPEMSGSSGLIVVTSTVSLTATRNLVVPLTKGFNWQVQNSTTGGQSIVVIGTSGTGVTIPNGATANVHSDGTNVTSVTATTSLSVTGPCPAGGTGSCAIGTPGSGATPTAGKDIMNDITGQGWGESLGTGAFSSFCTPLNALCSGSGGTPGGANTQIQFNNSGAFGADANFRWNASTGLGLGKAITQTKAAALNDLYLGDGTPVFGSFPTLWSMQSTPAINGPLAGLEVGIYPAAGANSTTNHIVGFAGVAWPSDNFNYHVIHGVGGDAENPGTGTVDSTEGVVGTSFLTGSGTTTSAVGVDSLVDNFGTGLITNGYALYASRATSGRFTNLYGLYIEPQTIGTALNYNLYSAGATTQNYFEGIVTGKTYKSVSITDGCATWASNVLGSTGVACGSGGSGVSSFAAPSGSWPSWLVPTVTSATTTPSLAVAASAIPNSALATQTANTVLGALTATTPSGLAMPSCSGPSNALIWTSGTGFGCNTISAATTIASSETVASSTTPTFSTSYNVSYNVLTASVTTFTLAAGADGQAKTLTFCENGTGGFTVAPPANVHGFMTVGSTASKCSSQHFNYSTAQTAWLADSPGVINQ